MSPTKINACRANKILKVVIRPILSETAPQKKRPNPLNMELTAMSVAPAAANVLRTFVSVKFVPVGMRSFNISCSNGD